MANILFIAAIILIILWWLDSIRTKELARMAGLQVCQKNSVQFLDDTVVSKKIFLRRNDGRLQICRVYQFEFCSDGADRYQGKISMQGHKVNEVTMDVYRIP
jgi:hypothetical protein